MKFILKILFLLTILSANIKSFSQVPIWTVGTPKTIDKHEVDLSLFYFSSYGLTDRLEIQTKPLEFFVLPHVNLKKTWYYHKSKHNKNWLKSRSLMIGSVHGINYPSMTLKLARNRQFRNLIPLDTDIPFILSFRNELLISTMLKNKTSCEPSNNLLTLKLGTKFSYIKGENTLPYFDNPFLFRETSIYHNKLLWYIGLGLDGHLYSNLNYSIDFDYKSIGLKTDYKALEHNGIIYWYAGKLQRFRLAIGYKASFSDFPNKKVGFSPLFDITFMFKTSKSNSSDLFDSGVYSPDDSERKNNAKAEEDSEKKKKKKDKEEDDEE